jgi:hypothetical protein
MKPNTKGIFIDSENKTITEKEVSSSEDIYKLLKIRLFDVVQISHNADLIVDDEGLLKENYYFQYGDSQLAGNGLVVGLHHDTGDWGNSPLTLEEVKSQVKFLGSQTDLKFVGYFEGSF